MELENEKKERRVWERERAEGEWESYKEDEVGEWERLKLKKGGSVRREKDEKKKKRRKKERGGECYENGRGKGV